MEKLKFAALTAVAMLAYAPPLHAQDPSEIMSNMIGGSSSPYQTWEKPRRYKRTAPKPDVPPAEAAATVAPDGTLLPPAAVGAPQVAALTPPPPVKTKPLGKVLHGTYSLLDVGTTNGCGLLMEDNTPVRISAEAFEALRQQPELTSLKPAEGALSYLVAIGNQCGNLVNGVESMPRDYGILLAEYVPQRGFRVGAVNLVLVKTDQKGPTGVTLYQPVRR